MAEATETKKKTESSNDTNKKSQENPAKAATKIEAYLSGPRKKRKNYVIFALGDRFDKDISYVMDSYVRKNHSALSVSNPRTPDDLTRQFGRNISLLIISDEFCDPMTVMQLIRALKEKRRNELIPVLFLTKHAEALVALYHKELLAYHEGDEYIEYSSVERSSILARIKYGIENKNQRRSRRYSVKLPMTFYHLNRDEMLHGDIIDLSLHGALILAERDVLFQLGDQIKLIIPVSKYVQHDQGDFLRVSAKVRRVFISGNKVAVSFEHVTEMQNFLLSQLLIHLVDTQFHRQTTKIKAQEKANTPEYPTR